MGPVYQADWCRFASAALSALVTNTPKILEISDELVAEAARDAARYADAMLKQLKSRQQ
jgi:hypothetical protein